MIETTISGCRVALGKAELKVRLMKIGIAVEGESLMICNWIYYFSSMIVIDICSITCTKTGSKTSDESSVFELFVETFKPIIGWIGDFPI